MFRRATHRWPGAEPEQRVFKNRADLMLYTEAFDAGYLDFANRSPGRSYSETREALLTFLKQLDHLLSEAELDMISLNLANHDWAKNQPELLRQLLREIAPFGPSGPDSADLEWSNGWPWRGFLRRSWSRRCRGS